MDNPPKFEKIFTFILFTFIFAVQYISNLLSIILPKKILMLKIAKSLKIASHETITKYQIDDNLPPLKYKRTTPEQELAGFKHEMDKRYKPVLSSFSSIYNICGYSRMKKCFHREICSAPTDIVQIRMDNGQLETVINTCSYNYLGVRSDQANVESLIECGEKYGLGIYMNRSVQDHELIQKLEAKMAKFMQTEDCICHFMGYDTNAMIIPTFNDGNTVLYSDTMNHNSLIRGSMYSQCKIAKFSSKYLNTLEEQLIKNEGKRGIVIVEGLYSMEGTYIDLPRVVALRDKYHFLLYVDEAHSIGGIGQSGRGIADYYNIPRSKIDFSMGTFTKSFGSIGGYVAGSHELIQQIRERSPINNNYVGFCPMFAQQIINSLDFVQSDKGIANIRHLKENSIYLRTELKKLGFTVYGDLDSPVVPVLFYNPVKMLYIQQELLKRKISVVVVGFPAVPLASARVRFCVSAVHSREQLEYIVSHMNQIGDYCGIKFEKDNLIEKVE